MKIETSALLAVFVSAISTSTAFVPVAKNSRLVAFGLQSTLVPETFELGSIEDEVSGRPLYQSVITRFDVIEHFEMTFANCD